MGDEIKLLMRTTKNQPTTTTPSPLAERNTTTGKLFCKLCKRTVGDDALWIPHAASKLHRDNVETAKKQVNNTNTALLPIVLVNPLSSTTNSSSSSTTTTTTATATTKINDSMNSNNVFINNGQEKNVLLSSSTQSSSIIPNTVSSQLPSNFYDGTSSLSAPAQKKPIVVQSDDSFSLHSNSTTISSLPNKGAMNTSASSLIHSSSSIASSVPSKISSSSSAGSLLPMGFYDNTEADAKAHGLKIEDITKANTAAEFNEFMNWIDEVKNDETDRQKEEELMYHERSILSDIENKLYQGRIDIIKLLKERKDEEQNSSSRITTVTTEGGIVTPNTNVSSFVTTESVQDKEETVPTLASELLGSNSFLTITDGTAVRIKQEDIVSLIKHKKDNYYTSIQDSNDYRKDTNISTKLTSSIPTTNTFTNNKRMRMDTTPIHESSGIDTNTLTNTTNSGKGVVNDNDSREENDDTLDNLLDWRRKRI